QPQRHRLSRPGLPGRPRHPPTQYLTRQEASRTIRGTSPLLVCCVWPGERGYARSAEEALPGRPTAPEGRARPDLVCREAPRLIAHYEEYREADKSDFALQGCSGMKFEVGEPEAIVT